ncbi:MAG TPA: redoxin domain-containing protein [Thermoanaerobaculia bacterium]|nr:redoxin domain-containing protein [Thermoanaerobaculia bacterium]
MINRVSLVLLIAAATLTCTSESPERTGPAGMAAETSTAEGVEAGTADVDTETPAMAQKAPDFTLTNHRGEEVTLSAALGSPVVLAFYRGHW